MSLDNAEILNYKGDAGLAAGTAGSNVTWEYGEGGKLDVSAGFKDFMTRVSFVKDMQQRQKIADRDKIFDQIATQKMDIDKVLPEARQPLLDKIKEVEDLWVKNPDLSKNPQAYRELQDKLREFNELNAHAKTNYISATTDLQEAAKIDDPDDRKLYMDHIKQNRDMLKDHPYELYEPYAKPLKMDYDAMAPDVPTTTTKVGENGYNDVNTTFTDPNEMIKKYNWGVVEGNDSKMRNRWLDFDTHYFNDNLKSPDERKQEFAQWNKTIIAANSHMATDIPVVPVGADGQPQFSKDFTLDDFHRAAYVALRYKEGKAEVINKDRAAIDKTKSEINENNAQAKKAILEGQAAHTKAVNDGKLKGSQIRLNDAKAKAVVAKLEKDTQDNSWSYAYMAAGLPTSDVFVTDKDKEGKQVGGVKETLQTVAVRDMPKSLQTLTADYSLSGKKNAAGKPLTPFTTTDSRKLDYYIIHPVKDSYIQKTGALKSKQEILGRDNIEYKKVKNDPTLDYKEWLTGKKLDDNEDSFVQYAAEKLGYKPEIVIQGKDGSATSESIESNQTIRDNQSKSSKVDEDPEGMKEE